MIPYLYSSAVARYSGTCSKVIILSTKLSIDSGSRSDTKQKTLFLYFVWPVNSSDQWQFTHTIMGISSSFPLIFFTVNAFTPSLGKKLPTIGSKYVFGDTLTFVPKLSTTYSLPFSILIFLLRSSFGDTDMSSYSSCKFSGRSVSL